MPKFYGIIGYAITEEVEKVIETLELDEDGDPVEETVKTGVWVDDIVERSYTGDVIRNRRTIRSAENVNPDITISDTISIIADGFALVNLHLMRYVKWRDATWAIGNITIERPRIILEIGGLYSG